MQYSTVHSSPAVATMYVFLTYAVVVIVSNKGKIKLYKISLQQADNIGRLDVLA